MSGKYVMSNRDYNYRQHKRYVKGIRRIRADRAEHGDDHSCLCFCPDADKGRGYIFSVFADTPKRCSNPGCCGNQRKAYGPTRQERKHLLDDE